MYNKRHAICSAPAGTDVYSVIKTHFGNTVAVVV